MVKELGNHPMFLFNIRAFNFGLESLTKNFEKQ